MSRCIGSFNQIEVGGMAQSVIPQVKHAANSGKSPENRKGNFWTKAWLAKRVSIIWGMASTRQQKKHEEPPSSPSKSVVSKELYKICCALSRIPHTTFAVGNSTYHSVKWPIQKLRSDYALIVPPPYNTDIRLDVAIDLSDLLYKLPDSMKIIYEKADPKKLINLMLPEGVIDSEARKVAAAFWLWLCIVDDILEDMGTDEDFAQGINDMHASLAGGTDTAKYNSNSQISFITHLFRGMVYSTVLPGKDSKSTESQWQQNLIACVHEIAHAFAVERPLFNAGKKVRLEHWMNVRVVTISARPFMILAKASLNIPGGMSRLGNPLLVDYEKYTGKTIKGETEIVRLEATLQCILGLQNDILGWEKDNANDLNLNCIQVLIAKGKASMDSTNTDKLSLTAAIEAHNQLVVSAVSRASELLRGSRNTSGNSSRRESLVPSLSPSDDDNINSSSTSADASPETSAIDLCFPNLQQQQPREAEVDIVDTDSEAESRSTREVSFRLFGRIAKFSWSTPHHQSMAETPSRDTRTSIHNQDLIERERICQYVRVLLNMANGMANWMIVCKRYAVKKS